MITQAKSVALKFPILALSMWVLRRSLSNKALLQVVVNDVRLRTGGPSKDNNVSGETGCNPTFVGRDGNPDVGRRMSPLVNPF
jgi:hypothetical protein